MHRRCSQSLANLCSKSLLGPATHASLASSLQQSPGVFQTWEFRGVPLPSAPSRFHQSGATTIGDESRAAGGFKGRPEPQARDYSFEGNRVPLNPWEQVAVAVGSAVGALMNPARADLVAALGETTGGPAFHLLLDRMERSPEGRRNVDGLGTLWKKVLPILTKQILKDRPRVISSAVQHAWDMPENTFGAAYAKFMGSRNFSPDDRPPVRYLESEELAYVATRAREVHDFWHVLFNCPTTVTGELALKMVEFQQTLLPMCFLSVAGASWRLKPEQRAVLFGHYGPWAMRAGSSANDLMCIYYEKHLHEDLAEVRRKWGIIPAPHRPKKKLN